MYKIHILNTIEQLDTIDFEIELTDDSGVNPPVRMWKNYPADTTDEAIKADFDATINAVWNANNINQNDVKNVVITQDVDILDNTQ